MLSDNNDFDGHAHSDANDLIKRIYEKKPDGCDFNKLYITAQVKTLMLRFALNLGFVESFKKGCTIQFEGDALPTPEIFKWVRRHLAKHNTVPFADIEPRYEVSWNPWITVGFRYSHEPRSSLLDLALSYPTLQQRYEAVHHLIIGEQESNPTQTDNLVQALCKRIITGSRTFIPLLETAGDGRALFDMCLHFNDILSFHDRFVHINGQKASEDSDPKTASNSFRIFRVLKRILDMSPSFWTFGLLERVLDRSYTHVFRDKLALVVYRDLLTRLVPAFNDLWRQIDPQDYQNYKDLINHHHKPPRPIPKVEPRDLVRFLNDLVQLKLGDVLEKALSTMAEHLTNLARSTRQHDSQSILEGFWIPLLHELAAKLTSKIGNHSTLLLEPKSRFQPIFRAALIAYARVRVGEQPPSNATDLARRLPRNYRDRPELADLVKFMEDPIQKEGRFPNLDREQKTAAHRMTEKRDVEIKHDRSTRPSTIIMIKLSKSDPEKHEAWNKRKEEFKTDVLLKFPDQDLLKEILGGILGYEELMNLTFLRNEDQHHPSVSADIDHLIQQQESSARTLQAIRANTQLAGTVRQAADTALDQGSENADRANKRLRVE